MVEPVNGWAPRCRLIGIRGVAITVSRGDDTVLGRVASRDIGRHYHHSRRVNIIGRRPLDKRRGHQLDGPEIDLLVTPIDLQKICRKGRIVQMVNSYSVTPDLTAAISGYDDIRERRIKCIGAGRSHLTVRYPPE